MQIFNKTQLSNVTTNEKQLELSKNETYNAQIKSRMSESEAVIQIKGKDFNVKFEDAVPKENRVSVQISDIDGSRIKVKTISTSSTDSSSNSNATEKMIEDMNLSEKNKNELRMATTIVGKKTSINRDTLVKLNSFFENETGTIEEKLVSLRALANKNLEVSYSNLRSIHAAINGESLDNVVSKIANAIDPNFQNNVSKKETEINSSIYNQKNEVISQDQKSISNKLISEFSSILEMENDIQKGIELIRSKLNGNAQISKENIKNITQAIQDTEKLQTIAKTRIIDVLNVIKTDDLQELTIEIDKIKDQVNQEPNLQKAIQTVKETIVNNPKMPQEVVNQVEQAIREATINQRLGQESAGREKLVQAITQAEKKVETQLKPVPSQDQGKAVQDQLAQTKDRVNQEPNLQKAIQTVKETIVNNPKMPQEVVKQVEQAIREATVNQRLGQESAGREKLVQAITQAEKEVTNQQIKPVPTEQGKAVQDQLAQTKDRVNQEPNLQKAIQTVKETIVNNPKMPQEVVKQVEQAIREATINERLGQESAGRENLVQAITQAEKKVETQLKPVPSQDQGKAVQDQLAQTKDRVNQEPNLQKAIQTVKETIVNNPKMPQEVVKQVEQAIREATINQRLGQESAGREKLVQAITQAEKEVTNQQIKPVPTEQGKAVQDQLAQTKDQVNQEPNLQKAIQTVKETIVNNPKMPQEVVKQVEQAIREATINERLGQESAGREKLVQAITQAEKEVTNQQIKPVPTDQGKAVQDQLAQTKDQVNQEPNLQKAIQTVKETIVNNPKMPQEVVKQVEQAIREATINQRLGQESAGREKLVQAITQAEKTVETQFKPVPSQDQGKAVQDQLAQTKDQVNQEPNLQKAIQTVKETIINNPKMPQEVVKQVEQAIREATINERLGQESAGREKLVQAITQAEKKVETQLKPVPSQDQGKAVQDQLAQTKDRVNQEPNLQKAIQTVKETIVNNPRMPQEVVKQVEQAIREATINERLGQESAGREKLVQAITQAEKKVETQLKPVPSQDQGKAVQDQLAQTKDRVNQEPNLQKAIQTVKETIVNNPRMPQEVVKQVEQAIREATINERLGQESAGREKLVQAITQAEKKVETQLKPVPSQDQGKAVQDQLAQTKDRVNQEPNLQKAIQTVKETIVNNPKMPQEVVKQVEQAIREATINERLGQESAGREKLVQAITQAEKKVETQFKPVPSQDQGKAVQDQLAQTKDRVNQEPNLQKAIQTVKETIVNNPKMPQEVVKQVEQAIREATINQRLGQESAGREKLVQAITQAEKKVETQLKPVPSQDQGKAVQDQLAQTKDRVNQEPNLQKAIQTVKETIVNNPKMPQEVVKQVEQAIREATINQRLGQESAGREKLVQAITQAEKTVETQLKPVSSQDQGKAVQDQLAQTKDRVNQEPNLQKAIQTVKETIVNNPKMPQEVVKQVEQAIREATINERLGQESAGREKLVQAITQAEKKVETQFKPVPSQDQGKAVQDQLAQTKDRVNQEPNLQKAIQTVKETIVNNPKMPQEVVKQVEQAIREATINQRLGQESAGREKLVQAITQAEKKVETQLKPVPSQDQGKAVQDQLAQTKDRVNQEPNLQKAIQTVKETIVNNPKMPQEVVKQVEQAIREATINQRLGQESAGREKLVQAITQAEKTVETQLKPVSSQDQGKAVQDQLAQTKDRVNQEPNLQKAIQTVKETIVNNPKMPQEVVKQVEQAIREATINQRLGQESAGREKLVQAITQAEKTVETQLKPVSSQDQGKAVQDQLAQTKDRVNQEPNLQKAIQTVKETIVNNPKMPQEVVKQVEQAIKEASILKMMGKEQLGLNKINHVLQQASESTNNNDLLPSQQTKEEIGQLINNIKNNSSITNVLNEVKELVANNKTISPQNVKQLEQVISQAEQLNGASKERLKTALNQSRDMDSQTTSKDNSQLKQVENNKEIAKSNATTQLQMDSIKKATKQIQKEPILEKALNELKTEIVKNEHLSPDKKEKIEKAINTSLELNSKGREMASRQSIADALKEVETAIQQENTDYVEDGSQKQVEMDEKRWDSQLQAMGIASKDIMVTKISQKLAEATHEFRDIKREIYRNLDNAQKLMEKYKDASIPQVSKMIESTINKLDQTILKSDLMLYADMRTEKRLLQASSQLAEAKKQLANGNTAKATEIVSEVKKMVDSIQYKPSEQKIVHYVAKNSALLEEVSPLKSLVKQAEDIGRNYILEGEQPSSRHMYEKIRSLGLNRESDVANSLVSAHVPNKEQEENLKSTLLKLLSSENLGDEKLIRQAEQALNNISGQQLLNKQDSASQLQSMFFNLPMLLGEKNENIQVFINSKSKGEQVDWENCNLYFLLETKKLGDVGILLNATDRNLSITVKNDTADFETKMSPLSKIAVDRLQEIGYQVQNIQFTHLISPSSERIKKTDNEKIANINNFLQEKGVNLQI
ncbi:hypothetical protein AB3U99_19820 [Niallia sp. JL1B1071]|uniref:hypothetical protein n=1 Tax=Niallia tiangongensis TaxID=3237105 RepID=UPI0037DC78CC